MKKQFLVSLVLAAAIIMPGCGVLTDNAEHIGIVTAVEHKGWPWRAWSVYVKTDKTSSQEDVYCVEDLRVVDELKDFAEKGERVKLVYHGELASAPWRCENEEAGNHFVDSVKPVTQ